MRNTRNKRRLAEIQDNFEEDRSQGSSRDKSSVDPNENYITQVSQEIEGRIAKKLSQEFSKRESRILGALAKLDHFLTNPSVDSSTPKIKHTSVTGDLDNSESDLHEREGHHLDGSRRRNYIPDPDEVVHSTSTHATDDATSALWIFYKILISLKSTSWHLRAQCYIFLFLRPSTMF